LSPSPTVEGVSDLSHVVGADLASSNVDEGADHDPDHVLQEGRTFDGDIDLTLLISAHVDSKHLSNGRGLVARRGPKGGEVMTAYEVTRRRDHGVELELSSNMP
jgi:hypothetical protein